VNGPTAYAGSRMDGAHRPRSSADVAVGMARRSGDESFTAFVTAHYARLLHVADLIVGDRGRAEDVLQSVLERTYLRWGTIGQDNPLGYVRAGLTNARTDWWRRGFARERPRASLPDVRTSPDHAARVAGRDAIQRALAVLTRRERAVIVLRYFEDLSEAEIARTLGVAAGTVKSTCARALAKLRISPDLDPSHRGEHP
jgi:RNA polymerase sigma-70 factor (sigma-E family)